MSRGEAAGIAVHTLGGSRVRTGGYLIKDPLKLGQLQEAFRVMFFS